MLQNQLGMGGIARIADHGSQPEHFLPQAGAVCHILHLVHITVIFHRFQKTLRNRDHVLFYSIFCKSERKSEKHPSFSLHKFHFPALPFPAASENRFLTAPDFLHYNLFPQNMQTHFYGFHKMRKPSPELVRKLLSARFGPTGRKNLLTRTPYYGKLKKQ